MQAHVERSRQAHLGRVRGNLDMFHFAETGEEWRMSCSCILQLYNTQGRLVISNISRYVGLIFGRYDTLSLCICHWHKQSQERHILL